MSLYTLHTLGVLLAEDETYSPRELLSGARWIGIVALILMVAFVVWLIRRL